MITIWNTKYCLTTGITRHEVDKITNGMVAVGPYTYLHGEGKEFHLTERSALDRAEEVRIKKLQSLDKQIKKISMLKFSCNP